MSVVAVREGGEPVKLLITLPQAASLASVSESTAKRLALSGEWPSVKIGRARRVVVRDLECWINGHKDGEVK